MIIAKSFVKVLLGRSLLSLTENNRLNFFFEKTDLFKYYFNLLFGFSPNNIIFEYDKTLPPFGFAVYINDLLKYKEETLSSAKSFVIREGCQEVFDDAEYLLFVLFETLSLNINDFFDEYLFEKWLDDSIFYERGVVNDKQSLYEKFCNSFVNNTSLLDKRYFIMRENMPVENLIINKEHTPLLLKSLFLLAGGRILKAQNLLRTLYTETAAEEDGADYMVSHMLGNFFLSQGKKDEAMSYFRQNSKKCNFYNTVLYISARYAFESGDPYISSQIISCAKELYPSDYMIKYLYCELLISTGRERTGLKKLEELVAKKGVFPGILAQAALLFIDNYEKSYALLEKSLSLNPEHVETMFVMAQLYFSNGLTEEALVLLDKIISLDKLCAKAFNLRGRILFSLERLEQVESDLKKSVYLDSYFIFDLAEYYIFTGNIENALPLIDETLSNEPFHIKANEYRANFFIALGELQKASSIYLKLLFLNPENIEYMVCLADLNFKLNDETTGLELLCKAFKMSPSNELVAETLGWYYLEKGHFENAEKVFDACIAGGNCENILVLCGKAVIAYKKKRFDEAKALCSLCLSLSSECDRALFILSKICLKFDDVEGALKYIKSALKIVPDSEEYKKHRRQIQIKAKK